MPLWKVDGSKTVPVEETSFKDEKILESKLEDWLALHPEMLGEPLLVIGQQVTIADLYDRIDQLALDRQGNVVVIEIKREDLTAPVDIQESKVEGPVRVLRHPLGKTPAWRKGTRDAAVPLASPTSRPDLFPDQSGHPGSRPSGDPQSPSRRSPLPAHPARPTTPTHGRPTIISFWVSSHRPPAPATPPPRSVAPSGSTG